MRNRNDKIFKYLNQDIRGNCYKQSNVVMITHLRKQVKTNLEPTHVTLYMCGCWNNPFPISSWLC